MAAASLKAIGGAQAGDGDRLSYLQYVSIRLVRGRCVGVSWYFSMRRSSDGKTRRVVEKAPMKWARN